MDSYETNYKLSDFGISKLYDPEDKTISLAKVANTNFSPPEQYRGHAIKELIVKATEIEKNRRFRDMLEIKKHVEAISHLYSLKLLL